MLLLAGMLASWRGCSLDPVVTKPPNGVRMTHLFPPCGHAFIFFFAIVVEWSSAVDVYEGPCTFYIDGEGGDFCLRQG